MVKLLLSDDYQNTHVDFISDTEELLGNVLCVCNALTGSAFFHLCKVVEFLVDMFVFCVVNFF